MSHTSPKSPHGKTLNRYVPGRYLRLACPCPMTLDAVHEVFERCPLGIFQIDVRMNIVYANHVALEVAGIDKAHKYSVVGPCYQRQ